MPKILSPLVFIIACNCIVSSAEPPAKSKRPFPAKLQIVSSKMSEDGYRELNLEIVLEEDIAIYEEWNEDDSGGTGLPMAKIAIMTADGTALEAEVTYPKPNVSEEINGVGTVRFYADALKLTARFKPPADDSDLKIRCRLAGMNRRYQYCLGRGRIETELPPPSP